MTLVQRILSSCTDPSEVRGLLQSVERWKRGVELGLGDRGMVEVTRYLETYQVRDVVERRFFNFGGGSFWHPAWHNVDLRSDWYAGNADLIDIHQDFSLMNTYPIESDAARVVYTSHTIEHLLDEHVAHMFREAYRILEPGGCLRVTCPDVDLFEQAYREKNDGFFTCTEGTERRTLANMFVAEFATQLACNRGEASPTGLSECELGKLLSGEELGEAYDFITSLCDFEVQQQHPGHHINWWNPKKVRRFLSEAGFEVIEDSSYGKSSESALWSNGWFDGTWPSISLYMEARK